MIIRKTVSMASLENAIKAKSPVVAIPVEGWAPVCLDRKRLAAWSKGVRIISAVIEQRADEWNPIEVPLPWGHEGPRNRIAEKVSYPRTLRIEGTAGRVRTTARFLTIDRRTAVKELSKWSAKERDKLQKKIMLGALNKDQKKALKRAKYEEDGEGMIPVMVAGKETTDPKTKHMGVPVSIPEMKDLSFAVVRFGSDEYVSYSVTELSSGLAAGFGKTAEEAICKARENARSVSPERLAEIMNQAA